MAFILIRKASAGQVENLPGETPRRAAISPPDIPPEAAPPSSRSASAASTEGVCGESAHLTREYIIVISLPERYSSRIT